MASIKKIYSFSNKRNIWRLVPSESGYLVIEERDPDTKEVFFNCLKAEDGKVYFKNFQLDEKYWIGIETVFNSIIFFHMFRKPDMPGHKGIYAFDILTEKLIWQNDYLIFLLAKDEKVYAYQQTFDGRQYFVLDCRNGKIVEDYGCEVEEINKLREESMQNDFMNSILIPKRSAEDEKTQEVSKAINHMIAERKVIGEINWLKHIDIVLINFHEKNTVGTLNNNFWAFNISKNKIVLTETINSKSNKLIAESFFMINDLLFLLVEKTKLVVYRIKQ